MYSQVISSTQLLRINFWTLAFLISGNLMSQGLPGGLFPADSSKFAFGARAGYSFASTAITNRFINSFYRGGFLDEKLKQRVLDKTGKYNRAAADANADFWFFQRLDSVFGKPGGGLIYSVGQRTHFNTVFSEDAFALAFFGNKRFAGTKADMNDFRFNYLSYQKVSVGLLNQSSYIGFNILHGHRFYTLEAERAELYTAEDGSYLDFSTKFKGASSDTSSGSELFQGLGGSLDLQHSFGPDIKNYIGKITAGISDFGLIRWNASTVHISQDSTYHFTGFRVNDLFDLQDSTVDFEFKNIVGNTRYLRPDVTITPAQFVLRAVPEGKNYSLEKGFIYRINSYSPGYLYLRFHKFFGKRLALAAEAGYGGHGKVIMPFYLKYTTETNWEFDISTLNLLGYILPSETTTQGLFISISKRFYEN